MSEKGDSDTSGGWSDRVGFTGGMHGTAYRLHEVIVFGDDGRARTLALYRDQRPTVSEAKLLGRENAYLFTFSPGLNPVDVVNQLRAAGVVAQLNYALFAHGDWCCCGPHPASLWQYGFSGSPLYGSPLYGSPLYGSPLYGSPLYGSPLYGSPLYGSPLYGSPLYGSAAYGSPEAPTPPYGSPIYAQPGSQFQVSGMHHSSAVPCPAPSLQARSSPPGGVKPKIVILDTGLAIDGQRPPSLDFVNPLPPADWGDAPDHEPDQYLDPAVGHGTFIAGLINALTPGCAIWTYKVLSNLGDGFEWTIADAIGLLDPRPDLLNLSFGGYGLSESGPLALAIAQVQALGTVVVASAGNDSICRPCYPAAFHDVIGVAAVGPSGPAGFSNYGDWVRACAPGVDMVSTFFTDTTGPEPAPAGYPEPDDYLGWTRWSGTSFSAPVVVAALAREMQCYGLSASDAVAHVIDGPALLRIPMFGTVVNLQ
jgi:Subtilase family